MKSKARDVSPHNPQKPLMLPRLNATRYRGIAIFSLDFSQDM
jgi:hypothetical protein